MFSTCLRFGHSAFWFCTTLATKVNESQVFTAFKRKFLAKVTSVAKKRLTHFGSCYRITFRAFMRCAHVSPCFRRSLSAKLNLPELHLRLRGMFQAQVRTGGRNDIEPLLSKLFQDLKPVLLLHGERWQQHQFKHFEGEGTRAVLVKGCLQFGIVVPIALKGSKMSSTTTKQIDCAANIDFSSDNTGDAVNSRCVGDALVVEWMHSYGLPKGCSLDAGSYLQCGLALLCFPHYTTQSRFL